MDGMGPTNGKQHFLKHEHNWHHARLLSRVLLWGLFYKNPSTLLKCLPLTHPLDEVYDEVLLFKWILRKTHRHILLRWYLLKIHYFCQVLVLAEYSLNPNILSCYNKTHLWPNHHFFLHEKGWLKTKHCTIWSHSSAGFLKDLVHPDMSLPKPVWAPKQVEQI